MIKWSTKKKFYQSIGMPAWWISQKRVEYKGNKMTNTSYNVIDLHTKQVVGNYKTLKRASNRANKLDLKYGAIRYSVRGVVQ